MYALADDRGVPVDDGEPLSCEMLTLGSATAIDEWLYLFSHVRQSGSHLLLNDLPLTRLHVSEQMVENFLMGDADLDCTRFYSKYPTTATAIMMSFQLLSSVLMV